MIEIGATPPPFGLLWGGVAGRVGMQLCNSCLHARESPRGE